MNETACSSRSVGLNHISHQISVALNRLNFKYILRLRMIFDDRTITQQQQHNKWLHVLCHLWYNAYKVSFHSLCSRGRHHFILTYYSPWVSVHWFPYQTSARCSPVMPSGAAGKSHSPRWKEERSWSFQSAPLSHSSRTWVFLPPVCRSVADSCSCWVLQPPHHTLPTERVVRQEITWLSQPLWSGSQVGRQGPCRDLEEFLITERQFSGYDITAAMQNKHTWNKRGHKNEWMSK